MQKNKAIPYFLLNFRIFASNTITMRRISIVLLIAWAAVSSSSAALRIHTMEVEHLASPLGIDTPHPQFSWQLASDERGCLQESYHIVVTDAGGAEVWNSGVVDTDLPYGVSYAGAPLTSRNQYTWTLTVTDNRGREASSQATFETAILPPDEWEAQWIGRSVEQPKPSMEILLDAPQHCRYLRLQITKLGTPASTDPNYTYAQLDEMDIYASDVNVALGATFKASSSWVVGNWRLSYINDGRIGDAAHLGWTTPQNPSSPVVLNIDLGRETEVDRVVLYPRQDDHAKGDASKAANFPASFTLQTSSDNSTYTTAYTATNVPAPTIAKKEHRIPYMGRSFEVDRKVKRARIYATALGVFTMRINGQPVTDAVLEPGESEYEKTILYSTYDVTPLLQQGRNTLLAQVAGGIYNIDYLDGRYSKGEVRNQGTPALLCELYVEYEDGETLRVVTDEMWRMTDSPTLGSNWWGGEDYDARLRIEDVDGNDVDMESWQPVELVTPHFESPHSGVSGHGVLRSRMYEPLRVVEQWQAVDVKTITSGGYVLRMIDFGRNFAGQYRFKLKGKKGQQISLRCGESLNPDGSVAMQNYYTGPSDTYDVYTFRGDEEGEEWGPEFMYHGFRYLQIAGLGEEPQPEAFTALRIRSDVDNIGSVRTGNKLINDIHTICRDAIASQLYNSITDCPQREKLGWLDVPNEMYVSLSSNFDMQNFYKKVVLDCFDAQQPNGMVPSVAPYYMKVYVDDVNWGGAAILVPYRNWRYYGDASLMIRYYDQMKRLLAHYTANTTGYIINNSFSVLSDWGQETAGVSPMVPTEFTETTTYYYLLEAMAEMADALGHTSDATEYRALASKVKAAFNAKFYDSTTATYTSVKGGGGRQSEQAMPLYYGLVPEGDEDRVAAVLAQRVVADGYKIRTGEIALKSLFVSLATYGYNDIVWQMSLQTDCPSYGYWVKQGYTTTPEYWDVGAFSQNHCMMDHIEEWFYTHLGGIQNRGMAFREFDLRPFIPADLDSCNIATRSSYGTIRSSWQRIGQGIQYRFEVPAGTQARIVIPVPSGQRLHEDDAEVTAAAKGIVSVTYATDTATVVVGSGHYRFFVPIPAVIVEVGVGN